MQIVPQLSKKMMTNKEKDICQLACWGQRRDSVFRGSKFSMCSISIFEKSEYSQV